MTATKSELTSDSPIEIDILILFEELKKLLFPLYKYKQGNCHNIAHYCSLVLDKRGISHKKIWYFAPTMFQENSRLCVTKADPNGIAPFNKLIWGYHVAILVDFQNKQHVFDYFIDETHPLTINDWKVEFGLKNYKIEIVTPTKYLFYTGRNNVVKTKKLTTSYFEYTGKSKENNWLPKALALNETAMEFIENEQIHLAENTYQSYDYKMLVGNIINFECVFRDSKYNLEVTKEFQNYYAELIAKYRKIYAAHLEKWIIDLKNLN